MPTRSASHCSLYALSAALALAACILPTKLGELSEAGDDTTGPSVTTSGQPTSGSDTAPPIHDDTTGGDSSEVGGPHSSGGACIPVKQTREPLSPNVVLVLDKSGSMVADPGGFWDHDADPNTPVVTRWSSLHDVVDAIVTDFDGSINFGAHLVPSTDAIANYSADACVVDAEIDIPVAAMNMSAILGGIPAADDLLLRGGTPTASGLIVALDHLKAQDPDVPRAILLVTDGAANCTIGAEPPDLFEVYDESIHTLVGDAFTQDGIPTYVVGVGIEDITTPVVKDGSPDDTNTFDRLNDLALAGGKPKDDPSEKFYNTVNQIELAAALGEIAIDALTCIVPLGAPVADPGATVVEIDGAVIPQVGDCATENGWVYTDPDGPFDTIELCGTACGGLKLTGEAEITVCMD